MKVLPAIQKFDDKSINGNLQRAVLKDFKGLIVFYAQPAIFYLLEDKQVHPSKPLK